jgi:hypothetical protein
MSLVVVGGCGRRAVEEDRQDVARRLGAEAYVFGYPLVMMDWARQASKSPEGQFEHQRRIAGAGTAGTPEPETAVLISRAWIDVTREPVVLTLPETAGRYYSVTMLDGWTNVFAAPGKRTTGSGRRDFLIAGPRYTGEIPLGLVEIRSPTGMVRLMARIQVNGRSDEEAVNRLQDKMRLRPLSAGTNPARVAQSKQAGTADPVAKMDAATFFGNLCRLMRENPPAPADGEVVAKFARIGIIPGEDLNPDKMDAETLIGLEQGLLQAQKDINVAAESAKSGKSDSGWAFTMRDGKYGTDYAHRAAAVMGGVERSLAEDAITLSVAVDRRGEPLNGKRRYVIQFPNQEKPPASAAWTLSAYDSRGLFAENSIRRYSIGSQDPLKEEPETWQVEIYVQRKSPGAGKESNWLPVPEGDFRLVLHLYWVGAPLLNGSWTPPPVSRVE